VRVLSLICVDCCLLAAVRPQHNTTGGAALTAALRCAVLGQRRSAAGPLRFRQSGPATFRQTAKLPTLNSLVETPAKVIEPVAPVPVP
jgi:hypothetical protein